MKCGIVMPVLILDEVRDIGYLKESINSVFNQEEDNWNLYIIDDFSKNDSSKEYLENIKNMFPDKIYVIFNSTNLGPGGCRNLGIKMASEDCEIIFFMDADDTSHPSRLRECLKVFDGDPAVDVVYSSFEVIDENSQVLNREVLSPSIRAILEGHDAGAPTGSGAWIEIGTKIGYTNLTSATAVRRELALRYPFPDERISEDMHTWLRYSAGGGEFFFISRELTQYRIPMSSAGSASRTREGGKFNFYNEKCRVDENGFRDCIEIAMNRHLIKQEDRPHLMSRFHKRLADVLNNEGFTDLSEIQLAKAKSWESMDES